MLEMSDMYYRRTGSYKILVGDRCKKHNKIGKTIKKEHKNKEIKTKQRSETTILQKQEIKINKKEMKHDIFEILKKRITSSEVIQKSLAEKSLAEF